MSGYLQFSQSSFRIFSLAFIKMSQHIGCSGQMEQRERKTSQKSEDAHAKDFMLTQGQRIYIQHHLPQYFSLVASNNHNSRLNNNSKTLLEESLTFIERKKGRPEGSCRKNNKKSQNDRKSERIASSKRLKSNQNEERIGQQCSIDSFQHFPNQSATQEMVKIDSLPLFKQFEAPQSCKQAFVKQIKEQINANYNSKPGLAFPQSVQEQKTIKQSDQLFKGKNQINKQKESLISSTLATEEKKEHQLQVVKSIPLIQQANPDSRIKKIRRVKIKEKQQIKTKQQQNSIKQIQQIQSQLIKSTSGLEQEATTARQIVKAGSFILKKLKNHKNILPFLEPVDEQRDGAPHYYQEISTPMDLKTIEFKLNSGIYKEADDFHSDIRLMWANSKLYNRNNAYMRQVTSKLQGFYLGLLAKASTREHKKKKAVQQ